MEKKREELKDKVKERRDALKSKLPPALQKNKKATATPHALMQMEMHERREGLKKTLDGKRADFQGKADLRKAALQKKIGVARGERVEGHFLKMIGKFSAAIGRLRDAVDRTEKHLAEAEKRDKNVSPFMDRLAVVDEAIGVAEQSLEDAKAHYGEMAAAPDVKEQFRTVADRLHAAREQIKATHAVLVAVVRDIKGLSGASDKK